MAILRNKTQRFVVVPLDVLSDERLKLEDIGMYALLACVDEKGYLPRALFEPPEDGRESVSVDALVRLKKYGYMDDEPIQEE